MLWDLKKVVEEIAVATSEGRFEAKEYYYGLAEGGTYLAPYHGLEDAIPREVRDLIEEKRQDIIAGRIVIPNIEMHPEEYWGL